MHTAHCTLHTAHCTLPQLRSPEDRLIDAIIGWLYSRLTQGVDLERSVPTSPPGSPMAGAGNPQRATQTKAGSQTKPNQWEINDDLFGEVFRVFDKDQSGACTPRRENDCKSGGGQPVRQPLCAAHCVVGQPVCCAALRRAVPAGVMAGVMCDSSESPPATPARMAAARLECPPLA